MTTDLVRLFLCAFIATSLNACNQQPNNPAPTQAVEYPDDPAKDSTAAISKQDPPLLALDDSVPKATPYIVNKLPRHLDTITIQVDNLHTTAETFLNLLRREVPTVAWFFCNCNHPEYRTIRLPSHTMKFGMAVKKLSQVLDANYQYNGLWILLTPVKAIDGCHRPDHRYSPCYIETVKERQKVITANNRVKRTKAGVVLETIKH